MSFEKSKIASSFFHDFTKSKKIHSVLDVGCGEMPYKNDICCKKYIGME